VTLDFPAALPPEALRRYTDPARFAFATTDELAYRALIIGQERALEALHFGLGINSQGFNLFVMGPPGTGRRSIIRRVVEHLAATGPTPVDWVYVNRFSDPRRPRAISLPPGMGVEFRENMERFNTELMIRLPRAYETEQYAQLREEQEQEQRAVQQQEFSAVERACQSRGFALVRSPSGMYIAPVRAGDIITPEAFSQLPEEERLILDQAFVELQDMLGAALRRLREHERGVQQSVAALDREIADFTLQPLMRDLLDKYAERQEVLDYLEEVRQDIIASVAAFRSEGSDDADDDISGSLLEVPLSLRYRVNVLVDNRETEGAPVLFEQNPTYENLLGRIEYDVRDGSTVTDYTLIRPGALHRANGGYLVLHADELLETPYAWLGLRRALSTGMLRIERPDSQQLVSTVTPEPEPISLRVKVILLGSYAAYYALYNLDPEFGELFKVRVEFDTDMERSPDLEDAYVQFIRACCEEEDLPGFTPEAVAHVVEFGARLADDQERLSTRFGVVADLVREAAYWLRQTQATEVGAAQVLVAEEHQIYRANLDAEKTLREIVQGRLKVATEGTALGEVNGLTVSIGGGYIYGMPTRITARAYMGRGSVVDIQRETRLGGAIHSKGVLTLAGYIGGHYGVYRPLAMEVSLSFEQVYDEIDGDSASAAELFALLSALSGSVPLRQDLAVTGAVDQVGYILPIGSVNEKIEGFFAVCRARGLTGMQGVVIPAANRRNLMLREPVVEAVRQGLFHIYAIETVDQGLELLTGMPAGIRDAQGRFPEASFHAVVDRCLQVFGQRLRMKSGRKALVASLAEEDPLFEDDDGYDEAMDA